MIRARYRWVVWTLMRPEGSLGGGGWERQAYHYKSRKFARRARRYLWIAFGDRGFGSRLVRVKIQKRLVFYPDKWRGDQGCQQHLQ